MPRTNKHTHACDGCGKSFPCDGDLEHNYDGFPEVICRAFHVHNRRQCEACDEQVGLMSNPALAFGSLRKPVKGEALIERKGRRADVVAHEQKELQAALVRDGRRCRFPGCTGKYRGQSLPIDPCHVRQPDGTKHRQMGGAAAEQTKREWAIALCRHCHGLYDALVLDIEAVDLDAGMNGCAIFFRKDDLTGELRHVATETKLNLSVAR